MGGADLGRTVVRKYVSWLSWSHNSGRVDRPPFRLLEVIYIITPLPLPFYPFPPPSFGHKYHLLPYNLVRTTGAHLQQSGTVASTVVLILGPSPRFGIPILLVFLRQRRSIHSLKFEKHSITSRPAGIPHLTPPIRNIQKIKRQLSFSNITCLKTGDFFQSLFLDLSKN